MLAGATATGKSEAALCLAERLDGEIISVDSMQVYRGLDRGTAKPSAADRDRVPHHLIDVVSLSETFDAARFVRLAREAVREIQARGRRPILCGGTGLYFEAFLKGLGDAPPADAALRAELAATPLPGLLAELAARDPEAYERIDRRNPRRVIRALEVIRLTGRPFSSQRADWTGQACESANLPFFGLVREPEDLTTRIRTRVDAMFQRGLVGETQELLRQGLGENTNARQAIGYREVIEHLRGERDLAQTIELVKTRTRQFAKRQMTWFRKHGRIQWIQCASDEDGSRLADRILASIER